MICHLHSWQNDRSLVRAPAVTRGWNGHRISVSTQSYLWRRGFELAIFRSRVHCSINKLVRLPRQAGKQQRKQKRGGGGGQKCVLCTHIADSLVWKTYRKSLVVSMVIHVLIGDTSSQLIAWNTFSGLNETGGTLQRKHILLSFTSAYD